MSKHSLTALQISILQELWECGEATVTELWEARRAERRLAPTTLATILARLERKGVVTHRRQARQFIYRATVTRLEVQQSMVGELTAALFDGDVPALVSHLLTAQDVSPADVARIRALLDRADQSTEHAR